MKNNFKIITTAIIFLIIICAAGPLVSNEFKIIIDMEGNRIEVPVDPKRIANLHGPSFDRIVMLGKADRLALISLKASPWAYKFYPQLKDIPIMKSYIDVDVEQMLKYKIDLVFYSLYNEPAKRLNLAGIKTANAFAVNKRPKTIPEFMDNFKSQVRFFGEVLGEDAKIRADKYCKYFDTVITKILSVTSMINKDIKPNVYYGMRDDLLSTQGKNTVMQWYTEVAGGIFLTQNIDNNYPNVTIEQVITWNPDTILIGYHGSDEVIKNKSNWNDLNAVKKGKVYIIPRGIFLWDMAGGESILLPLYLAKKFHPDLFKDWDIIQEMKKFYSEIYRINVTTQDAERILQALPPI